jgi:DNA-binding Lrp family transcriptional regulator
MIDSDKLDELDRRIVAALQVSGRAPFDLVGQVLGEHKRTVARRVQRLVDAGVLHVTVFLDELRCGVGQPTHLKVLVEQGTVNHVAAALADRADIRSVVAATGEADLVCELVAPSRAALHRILAEEIPAIPGVRDTRTLVTLRHFTTVAEWRAGLLSDEEIRALGGTQQHPRHGQEPTELTETDARVAGLLAEDGRLSYVALGDALQVSPVTAQRWVKRLIGQGPVTIRAEIEPSLLGYDIEAVLWMSVRAAAIDTVGNTLAEHPVVRYCGAALGGCNLVAHVVLPRTDELYTFIIETLGGLPEITEVDMSLVTHAYKRGFIRNNNQTSTSA